MDDLNYMRQALKLAKQAWGLTSPNPMVGALIVKDGQIISQGWHKKAGQAHAERMAIDCCQQSTKGATLYVTLEPCCHQGRQPPCTRAIIEAGIKRVVIGSIDPNPLVHNKGIAQLEAAGIEVVSGVAKEECDALNDVFSHYIQTGLPFVVIKYAMSLDGKIATRKGQSKWITNQAARENVAYWRQRYRAIMVGVQTVIMDNPRLTCRLANACQPIRIICDTHLRTPLTSYVVQTAKQVDTLIATCCQDKQKQRAYLEAGCKLILCPSHQDRVDLTFLFHHLAKLEIDSILVEGGSELHWSILEAQLAQKSLIYLGDGLIGGKQAKSPIGGLGWARMSDIAHVCYRGLTRFENNILIEAEIAYVHRTD